MNNEEKHKRQRIVFVIGIAIMVGVMISFPAEKTKASYKDPCNPYTTESTTQVVPGYYEDISGHCVVGDVSQLDKPIQHTFQDGGMQFYNGYNPTPPVPNYYSNQQFSTSTTVKPERHHGH